MKSIKGLDEFLGLLLCLNKRKAHYKNKESFTYHKYNRVLRENNDDDSLNLDNQIINDLLFIMNEIDAKILHAKYTNKNL